MATKSFLARIPQTAQVVSSKMFGGKTLRYFGDGRILSEEERAKETVYIQKMERERLEKLRKKAEKEKAEAEKNKTTNQNTDEPQKSS